MHPTYLETVKQLRDLCRETASIHGAVLLGSQIRDQAPGDQWSDLDVLLLVDEPAALLEKRDWLERFGEILCDGVKDTPIPSHDLVWSVRRVLFADNRAIDFSILPGSRTADIVYLHIPVHAVGYEVLYDDSGALDNLIRESLREATPSTPKLLPQSEVRQLVNDLLFTAVYACKKVRRGELWVAVSHLNEAVSQQLLPLVERHAAARGAPAGSIHYEGRFLETRAAPETLVLLEGCFASYDGVDLFRAADQVIALTQFLTEEIIASFGDIGDDLPFAEIKQLCAQVQHDEARQD